MPDKEPSILSIFEAVAAETWDKTLSEESDSDYQRVLDRIADLQFQIKRTLEAIPDAEGYSGNYQMTYKVPEDNVTVNIILGKPNGGDEDQITMIVHRSATDRPDKNVVTNYQFHRDGLRISIQGSQHDGPPLIVTRTNRMPVSTAEAAHLNAARIAAPILEYPIYPRK